MLTDFRPAAHSVETVVHPANIASCKVLEKCGFIKEGYFKVNEFYNGQIISPEYLLRFSEASLP